MREHRGLSISRFGKCLPVSRPSFLARRVPLVGPGVAMGRATAVGVLLFALAGVAGAASIPGGGSKRNDCAVNLQADGLAFPSDKARPTGVSCADGGPCDADGTIDGSCRLLVALCTNVESEALAACGPAEVTSISIGAGKLKGGGTLDTTDLAAAVAAMALPTSETICSTPAAVVVPVRGPDGKGELSSGTGKLKTTSATSRG